MSSPATTKRGRPLVWWGVGLIVVALLGGIVAGIGIVTNLGSTIASSLEAEPEQTPVTLTMDLEKGPYLVYERTGRTGGPLTVGRGLTVQPQDVRVVSADGVRVPVGVGSFTETITRGSGTYTGAVRFDIVQEGEYRIDIATKGTQVVVGPSLLEGFSGMVPWVALGGIGSLVFLVGAVLLIVGLVKGRGSKNAPLPAGWYADPQGAASWRWWDGSAWTDRTG